MSPKLWLSFGAVAAALVACQPSNSPTGSGQSTRSQTTPLPTPLNTTAKQSLTLTGDLTGQITSTKAGNGYGCFSGDGTIEGGVSPTPIQQLIVGPMDGTLNGDRVEIEINMAAINGPGTYTNVMNVVQIFAKTKAYKSLTGTVTVNPDLHSGSMDVTLTPDLEQAADAHVKGAWNCLPSH